MSWFPFHYRDIKAFSDDNLPLSTASNEAAKLFDSAITQLALHDNDPGMHIFSLDIKVLNNYIPSGMLFSILEESTKKYEFIF